MLANKKIWRAASPGHYDWSNVWSLTIRCHSPWQGEDCIQFMQSTPATYDHSKCVIFGKGGGRGRGKRRQRRIHSPGNFPPHRKLHFIWSVTRALTFPVNFPVKAFLGGHRGLSAQSRSILSLVRKPEKTDTHTHTHISQGTCNNKRIKSLQPDPCLCFYDLSQSEELGKPSQKCSPSTESAFAEVYYCFLFIKEAVVIKMWHRFIPCDFQMLASCQHQSLIDLYVWERTPGSKMGLQFGIST